ncbi:uncharacterized protein METZ01_LOCUS278359 [marine metagenome]|uniref:Uncharacterized protein n=1 Tax=marine metagenome TaxID=408172 RepID=A0A382KPK9_9ZZZZ
MSATMPTYASYLPPEIIWPHLKLFLFGGLYMLGLKRETATDVSNPPLPYTN